MSDTIVAIVSAFFVIGILVGIVAVIAAAVLRADRRGDQDDPADPVNYEPRGSGELPPRPPRDGIGSDDHPSWPGDADNHFRGR
jgi:hypothetical protein